MSFSLFIKFGLWIFWPSIINHLSTSNSVVLTFSLMSHFQATFLLCIAGYSSSSQSSSLKPCITGNFIHDWYIFNFGSFLCICIMSLLLLLAFSFWKFEKRGIIFLFAKFLKSDLTTYLSISFFCCLTGGLVYSWILTFWALISSMLLI